MREPRYMGSTPGLNSIVPGEYTRRWSDFWNNRIDTLQRTGHIVKRDEHYAEIYDHQGKHVASFGRTAIQADIIRFIENLSGPSSEDYRVCREGREETERRKGIDRPWSSR